MDQELFKLLEYQEVLGVVTTTVDGLVIASAAIGSDDAEIVAAAGSAILASARQEGLQGGSVAADGGDLHVLPGSEIVLVVLTERDAPPEQLETPMQEMLASIDASLSS